MPRRRRWRGRGRGRPSHAAFTPDQKDPRCPGVGNLTSCMLILASSLITPALTYGLPFPFLTPFLAAECSTSSPLPSFRFSASRPQHPVTILRSLISEGRECGFSPSLLSLFKSRSEKKIKGRERGIQIERRICGSGPRERGVPAPWSAGRDPLRGTSPSLQRPPCRCHTSDGNADKGSSCPRPPITHSSL